MILPAGLKYQAAVAKAVNAAKQAGASDAALAAMLKEIVKLNGSFRKASIALDRAVADHHGGGALGHARHMHDKVLPAMAELRVLGDRLELIVDDSDWPLPTYREMLFIR
jgi:glutamine synthetase